LLGIGTLMIGRRRPRASRYTVASVRMVWVSGPPMGSVRPVGVGGVWFMVIAYGRIELTRDRSVCWCMGA